MTKHRTANMRYGDRPGHVSEDHAGIREFMGNFDRLGPMTRAVINDARAKWGPTDLYEGGVKGRRMSDEALADLVKNNDAGILKRLEKERDELKGAYAEPIDPPKGRKETIGQAPVTNRRGRRPRSSDVQAAVERALKRSVPRIDDLVRP